MSTITNATPANSAGCCNSIYNASASGVTWLKTNSLVVASGAIQTAKTIASAVSKFFTVMIPNAVSAMKNGVSFGLNSTRAALVKGFVATKSAVGNAKEVVGALSPQLKAVAILGIAAIALFGISRYIQLNTTSATVEENEADEVPVNDAQPNPGEQEQRVSLQLQASNGSDSE